MRSILCSALALVLAGCGAGASPQDGEAPVADMEGSFRTLSGWSTGGCGDVTLFGRNATDRRAFFVSLNGMAEQAHSVGAIHRTFQLPSPEVSVRAEDGFRLTSTTCVGAFPYPGPRVTRSWDAVSGSVSVDVVPAGPSPSATATIHARNVVFRDGTGLTFTATSMRVPPTSVGFYPP